MLMAHPAPRPSVVHVLGDEGLRLFFPLAALHAAFWPFLWVAVYGFDLPLARTMPPSLWHAQEMIFGSFGAALIGFTTTAVPEWTDTPRPRGRVLFALAGLWGLARLAGLAGAEVLLALAGVADFGWLAYLCWLILRVSLIRRTDRLLAFLFWLGALAVAAGAARFAFLSGGIELAQTALRLGGFSFLALLALALARITPPITNLVLDPSEATSPYRPHPGRVNLAPGLLALLILGELAGLSPPITGYLAIAAGAAFMDRVAEAFIGREAARVEILALGGSAALAGAGLLAIGCARLGAPVSEAAGLHTAFMGGLGLGVLAVFALAGLLHTGRPLGLDRSTRLALLLLVTSVIGRIAPEFGFSLPGRMHLVASVLWAGAFLIWLWRYWPWLSDPATIGKPQC